MQISLEKFINKNETVAVAVSGGGDSMALLHYMQSESKKYPFNLIAINVEHGIRGESSISDTNFVISYCKDNDIPLLTFSVDCLSFAESNKLSLEQAGRVLRYQIFNQAISEKKCDKVATAHHLQDNIESVLFNLFRGTGLKGLSGIEEQFENRIIRPLLSVSKKEIEEYLVKFNIPHVVDQTNFDDKYTRNAIRLNLLPEIEKIFPEAQTSVYRFSQIAKLENDYMHTETLKAMTFFDDKVEIKFDIHPALLSRATVLALKNLGVEKDWEKAHIDSIFNLCTLQNSKRIDLKNGVIAIKEYDKICFYKNLQKTDHCTPFALGEIDFLDKHLKIEKVSFSCDLKNGLFLDLDKIPNNAVIRTRKNADKFTKFGGGTKSLNDYFTDIKVPLFKRDLLPLLAVDNDVLAIFNLAISDKVKVDKNTKTIIQFK